jgi:hypothetical protein
MTFFSAIVREISTNAPMRPPIRPATAAVDKGLEIREEVAVE